MRRLAGIPTAGTVLLSSLTLVLLCGSGWQVPAHLTHLHLEPLGRGTVFILAKTQLSPSHQSDLTALSSHDVDF